MSEPIRIRVYNVGFGDSILLRLPTPEGRVAKVLVDCGSLSFGDSGQNNQSLVETIIADVTENGVARIDMVIASHRHKDHISGFGRPEWRQVEVSEVWQPWTENPDDGEARRLFDAQKALALCIEKSDPQLLADKGIDADQRERILAMAMNALSNDESIMTLRSGFASKPTRHWLTRSRSPRRPRALDGLAVHVLGPSRNPDVIRSLNPPTGQSYLAMLGLVDENIGGVPDVPFPRLPRMDWEAFAKYGGTPRAVNAGQSIGVLRRLPAMEALLAASALDHALNNTSLMLMFEVGEQFLLFPGDSQWGTWKLALDSPWSSDLLARTTFYKIGHHGSHNATPRDFVEKVMASGTWSIASVGDYAQWKQVPKKELLAALEEKAPGHVFITKEPPADPPAEVKVVRGGIAIDFELPTN